MAGIDPIRPPQLVSPVGHSVITAGGVLLAIAGLYLGREFSIPFTLAILLAFALSPIVNAFRRWRVPRIPAVMLAVTFAFILIGVVSYVVAVQVIKLANQVPSYRQTMVEKIKSLQGSGATEGGVIDRIMSTIDPVHARPWTSLAGYSGPSSRA
jgi:predicted PurR-regulated permease PerM